jgi:glycosyltransferase 2 family protein
MRPIARVAPYFLVLCFAVWCGVILRRDLAQLSLTPFIESWAVVLAAAALSLLNYALRIIRWRFYLARLGYTVPRRFAALTYTAGFAYTVSPGKLGEMVRARYYEPVGVPISDITAAFFAERLLDLIVMVVLAALLLAASPGYDGLVLGAAVIVLVALALLAMLPWAKFSLRLKASNSTPGPLLRAITGLASALAATRRLLGLGALAWGLALGLAAWVSEGIGLGLLSSMFPSPHLDLLAGIGIYGVAVLIGGLSFLPGGLGSTEAVMTTLLTIRGYTLSQALAITLTCRLVTLWFAVMLGWLAVFALRERRASAVLP